MILVSGTRGPGFNSRIAPLFLHHNIDNHIIMTHRNDDSIDEEEFTKLRVELYRTQQRLQEQTRIGKMAEFYQQVLGKFIDVVSDRAASVENLAKIVGIKTNLRRDFSELKTSIGEEGNQRTIFGRIQKINLELDVQEELLGLIGQTVGQVAKDYDEIKSKYEKMSKEHTNCGDFGSLASGQLQKLKRFEKQMEQKDASILQLQKKNLNLQQQLEKAKKKYEQNSKQLTFLQKQLDKKNREIEENKEIAQTAQQTSKQKQKVLDNCQKLLQTINVPQDDYLKYYFRSNGLQLQPQKPIKNKYSIVFDH